MNSISGKSVIITGASSGIGEATAKMLAERGAKLMLAARREERLQDLVSKIEQAGGTATYQTVDVTNYQQMQALAQTTLDKYGKIDVLLNNAGLMPLSRLDKLRVEEWDKIVDVNIKGVLYGIAAVLPIMQSAKNGHIINISSVAGHVVFPGGAVYCGSKFAVRAISEGLRQEVGADIRCTIISPGAVATELTNSIQDTEASQNIEAIYQEAIDADAIARAIVYALEQPPEVDVNEILIRPTAQAL
ncbi:3-oxoacyl-(acyl-carrier-protein) reductase [Stanieria cyanosphaera PCC 7437]|uniref:3-oxoacyl-(Acyl-carrier-protein) reductase n=1 Tax=Stanieria cyanosphaera (strain ATCC 29371 / PCC 7437) TaxID=111780 RepID=K9XMN0_STAC7|nr:SDR family oxidoreductase [Stanieria cyanosphaera]AFZ33753.1 3-oxoacyl-(acyl-carrier-protein) reductase [Stanieria cyanosphaera PCC 7437]